MTKIYSGKDKDAEKFAINYFIIRETFHCMACTIDSIPEKDAMSQFYTHLDISEKEYDTLVESGYGYAGQTNETLFECLFSDTYFRTDSHTLIQMSEGLFNAILDYSKNLVLLKFREYLAIELRYICNPKNAILVIAVRRLISKMDLIPQRAMDILGHNPPVPQVKLESSNILAFNYFVIKELYICVATLRGIKRPIPRFYEKLGITEDSFEKMTEYGYGKIDKANILAECGFSDSFFRINEPELINMSTQLYEKIAGYKDYRLTSLQDFRSFLKTELGSFYNPDGTLLVEAIGNLVDRIYPTTEYIDGSFVDDISRFANMNIKRKFKSKPHYTEKDVKTGIKEAYDYYKNALLNNISGIDE